MATIQQIKNNVLELKSTDPRQRNLLSHLRACVQVSVHTTEYVYIAVVVPAFQENYQWHPLHGPVPRADDLSAWNQVFGPPMSKHGESLARQ